MGMRELGNGSGFGLEALQIVRSGELTAQEHLQCHVAPKGPMARLVNDAQAAPAELLQDLVVADLANDRRGGCRCARHTAQPRDHAVRNRVERPQRLFAVGTAFDVGRYLFERILAKRAQVEGAEFDGGRALSPGHGDSRQRGRAGPTILWHGPRRHRLSLMRTIARVVTANH